MNTLSLFKKALLLAPDVLSDEDLEFRLKSETATINRELLDLICRSYFSTLDIEAKNASFTIAKEDVFKTLSAFHKKTVISKRFQKKIEEFFGPGHKIEAVGFKIVRTPILAEVFGTHSLESEGKSMPRYFDPHGLSKSPWIDSVKNPYIRKRRDQLTPQDKTISSGAELTLYVLMVYSLVEVFRKKSGKKSLPAIKPDHAAAVLIKFAELINESTNSKVKWWRPKTEEPSPASMIKQVRRHMNDGRVEAYSGIYQLPLAEMQNALSWGTSD